MSSKRPDLSGLLGAGVFRHVRYYRPFGNGSSGPDGRYWFNGYSVFAKADISFHDSEEYIRLLRVGDPTKYITPPFDTLWERRAPNPSDFGVQRLSLPARTKEEDSISGLVYRAMNGLGDKVKRLLYSRGPTVQG